MFDPDLHWLFPVTGKVPVRGWKWTERRLTRPEFNDWLGGEGPYGNLHLAIALGEKSGGIFVTDYDLDKALREFTEATTARMMANGASGCRAGTPSGGLHDYWRGQVPQSGQHGDEQIDIKSDGGYVVLYPDAAGKYGHYDDWLISDAPTELLEWAAGRKGQPAATGNVVQLTPRPQGRNAWFSGWIFQMVRQGMDFETVLMAARGRWLSMPEADRVGFPLAEVDGIVQRKFAAGVGLDEPAIDAPTGQLVMSQAATLALPLPPVHQVIGPLYSATVLMIAGKAGVGKSLFTLHLAGHVAAGLHFERWHCPGARPVLYVDGEMATQYVQQRLHGVPRSERLDLIHLESMRQAGQSVDFGKSGWREYFQQPEIFDKYELFIFDTVSSLVMATEQDGIYQPGYWLQLEPFHQAFRAAGKTVIWVDNLNKMGQVFGTTVKHHKVDSMWHFDTWKGKPVGTKAGFEIILDKARGDTEQPDGRWYMSSDGGWISG